MHRHCAIFSSFALLAACVAPQQPRHADAAPFASEAQIIAAEQAPLSGVDRDWNVAVEPFTVIGNIHYVGVTGVSVFLITTPEGHILLDGAFAQSAPLVIANIERLGFDSHHVRYLLNSHAHYDHAAGLARLQRESGAAMIASAGDRAPLDLGVADGFKAILDFDEDGIVTRYEGLFERV